MDLFAFTRQLIDIESTSGAEGAVAQFLAGFLRAIPGLEVETYEVEPGRLNVFARAGRPDVVLSTHLDTVPPYFPSREDAARIHGRGACDAKGIIAAQVFAARELLRDGAGDFGLLYVVGEERDSAGAMAANLRPVGSRFLVNGEPTGSKLAVAGKGVLRVRVTAQGRLAHSAYPELGDSAIDKLLRTLGRMHALTLPTHPDLGPATLNIGTLHGGRAPNVIADQADAEILIRLVTPSHDLRAQLLATAEPGVQIDFPLELPPIQPRHLPGFPTCTVAFGTDIPKLSAWGEPHLFGPGSIHVAHTEHEFIDKSELSAAVSAYAAITRHLQNMPQ